MTEASHEKEGGAPRMVTLPIPRQQFMKSLLWHIGDAGEYVGKPGARVNAVQLGGLDQA